MCLRERQWIFKSQKLQEHNLMYTTVSTRKLSDCLQTRESMRVKCSGYPGLNDVAACGKSVKSTKPVCDVVS